MNDDSFRTLCIAICCQAAVDYKKALHGQYRVYHGTYQFCIKTKNGYKPASWYDIEPPEEYERFFASDWFKMMSGFENTEYIIDYLHRTKNLYFKGDFFQW